MPTCTSFFCAPLGTLTICLTVAISTTSAMTLAPVTVDIVVYAVGPVTSNPHTPRVWLPSYEVAVEELSRRYGHVVNFTYTVSEAAGCLNIIETPEEVLSATYYRLHSHNADRAILFLNPGTQYGCAANDMSVWSLPANWNSIAINTLGGMEIDRAVLPTALSIVQPMGITLVGAMIQLLVKYQWTSVFILLDRDHPTGMDYIAQEVAGAIRSSADGCLGVCTLVSITSNVSTNFSSILTDFRRVSRVMAFMGPGPALRRLMVTAHSMNMTDGSYVYIAYELFPSSSFVTVKWRANDHHDLVAKEAFRSVLTVQPRVNTAIYTGTGAELTKEFNRRTQKALNRDSPSVSPDVMLTSYNSVLIYGQVINETITNGAEDIRDGRRLIQHFLNRTFLTDFGDVYINSNGMRVDKINVPYFDGEHEMQQVFLETDPQGSSQLKTIGSLEWIGEAWPPPAEPKCGFDGQTEICKPKGSNSPLYGGFAGCLLLAVCICARIQYAFKKAAAQALLLNSSQLTQI